MIHVSYTIDDEFSGPVEVKLSLSTQDARKVARWSDSVAALYLGHEYASLIQQGLRKQLAELDG